MRTSQVLTRRQAFLAAAALGAVGRRAAAQSAAADDPWPSLAAQIFDHQTLADGSAVIGLDLPYRAEDAAVVPVGIHTLLPADDPRQIQTITLVIDQNPSPVAAAFSFGPNSGITAVSTRIRVDSYTRVHAVATTADAQLYAADRFVKAAGGCSAPAAKQQAGAIPLGTMRFRQFPPPAGSTAREAEIMIRHPNFSGMQMDQVSRLYVPAHFVSSVRLWQGDELLLAVESGISISENPQFRFEYRPNGAVEFRADVRDSQGQSFSQTWSAVRG